MPPETESPFAVLGTLIGKEQPEPITELTPRPSQDIRRAMKIFNQIGSSEKANRIIRQIAMRHSGFTIAMSLGDTALYFRKGKAPQKLPAEIIAAYAVLNDEFIVAMKALEYPHDKLWDDIPENLRLRYQQLCFGFEEAVNKLVKEHYMEAVLTEEELDNVMSTILADVEFYLSRKKAGESTREFAIQ